MKNLSKIIVLTLGFAFVGVLFFPMHSRAASPQASVTGSTNTLIALRCIRFKTISSNVFQCDGLEKWTNDGYFEAYTPTAGTALVITDMECSGVFENNPILLACYLGTPNHVLSLLGNNVPKGYFQLSTHLASGVTFNGFPGITIAGAAAGDMEVYLQGYLIQTGS